LKAGAAFDELNDSLRYVGHDAAGGSDGTDGKPESMTELQSEEM